MRQTRPNLRLAFTMIEVLLAMLILGVGLIMVATVLPVGANWNRQNVEESVASQIARNAVAIIRTKYTRADFAAVPVGTTLVAFPGISANGKLPLGERAFAYGSSPAYPAATTAGAKAALYMWTALTRRTPDPNLSQQNRYDIYVFVFKRGSADQTFANVAGEVGRDYTNDGATVPYLLRDTQANVLPVGFANFPVGTQGVGETSGTVFRKLAGSGTTTALITGTPEYVYYAPPGDGASVSPLIFIYQTTVAF